MTESIEHNDDLRRRAHDVLSRVFGLHTFRGFQLDVIERVAAGGDALVLMPTGGGKSLCYQIPALLREGVGVVVSPLIALMDDQVASLAEVGVRAAFINSSLTRSQVHAVKARLLAGDLDLLYVAPERLVMPDTLDLLAGTQIALFAIDEAHCVSMWGHDFRPEYGQLDVLRERWPEVPRVALTATADLNTREEICDRLLLHPQKFVASFDRPNIRYRVVEKSGQVQALKQLIDFIHNEHEGDSGIVYCIARARTEEVAQALNDAGISAMSYHAGLESDERSRRQSLFLRRDGIVMVATIAFGMGIDKPDVRFVAHLDMPKSIENYFQETGRAGRDGEPADAWMAYGIRDVVNQRFFIDASDADEVYRRRSTAKLDSMLALAETVGCRRRLILNYFAEEAGDCGNCDNCLEAPETVDRTVEAQKFVSCIYRAYKASGFSFGPGHIIDILTGQTTERVLKYGHDKLSTFGIGKDIAADEWRRILRQLVVRRLVTVDADRMNTLVLGEVKPLLAGREKVLVRRMSGRRAVQKRKGDPRRFTGADEVLFDKLKGWRRRKAEEAACPAYRVFPDATLAGIVEQKPRTLEDLAGISGIGQTKLERYGDEVLELMDKLLSEA